MLLPLPRALPGIFQNFNQEFAVNGAWLLWLGEVRHKALPSLVELLAGSNGFPAIKLQPELPALHVPCFPGDAQGQTVEVRP
jgi:hypothetical protein